MSTRKDQKDPASLWSEHDDNIEYFADTYIRDFAHKFVDGFVDTYALQFMEELALSMHDDFAFMFSKDYSEHFAEKIGRSITPEFVHQFVREYTKYEDQGELGATLRAIWNLGRNKGMSEEEAMDAMGIPADKRIVYEAALRHARQVREQEDADSAELNALEEFVIDMPDPGPESIIHYVAGADEAVEMEASMSDLGVEDAQTMRDIRELVRTEGMEPEAALERLGVPEMDRQAYLLLLSMEAE